MLLGTLGASLLENLLTGNGLKQSKIPGRGVMRVVKGATRASEGTITAGQDF